tara:strand:+ start:2394 stop:2750 length:357 start_codon:yes stop_codon:yes gene_type:complete
MRVLAFEDSYDIEALLSSGNVDTNRFTIEQKWDSKDAIETIKEFKPDILLLDHFMPPMKGLDVLIEIILGVEKGELIRPQTIIGISSAGFANQAMLNAGADIAINKFNIPTLEIWNEN